jgi:hypothetical protein
MRDVTLGNQGKAENNNILETLWQNFINTGNYKHFLYVDVKQRDTA